MRPRQFDEEAVLRIAFGQFRRKGVRGTSLADIAREAGDAARQPLQRLRQQGGALPQRLCAPQGGLPAAVERALSAGKLRERLRRFFDFAIGNFCAGSPPRGCPTTRGLMEIASVAGEGLPEEAREAFADLLSRLTALIAGALREGAARGEFDGDPEMGALHLVTVARGLVVLERAFGDAAQLHRIAAHAVETLLGPEG